MRLNSPPFLLKQQSYFLGPKADYPSLGLKAHSHTHTIRNKKGVPDTHTHTTTHTFSFTHTHTGCREREKGEERRSGEGEKEDANRRGRGSVGWPVVIAAAEVLGRDGRGWSCNVFLPPFCLLFFLLGLDEYWMETDLE